MKKPLWREKTKDKLFAISFPSLYTFSLQLRSNKRYSPLTKKKKGSLKPLSLTNIQLASKLYTVLAKITTP